MAVIHKEEPVVHNTVFGTERVNVSMYTLNARLNSLIASLYTRL